MPSLLLWLSVAIITSAASSDIDVSQSSTIKERRLTALLGGRTKFVEDNDNEESDEHANGAKVTRHLLRVEKGRGQHKQHKSLQRSAMSLPSFEKSRHIAHLEKLASNASEGELIEGVAQKDGSGRFGVDEDDRAEDFIEAKRQVVDSNEDQEDEIDGTINREMDEDTIRDERLKLLSEKLAAAEEQNKKLQRIAQVAAEAAFQAAEVKANTTVAQEQLKHGADQSLAALQDANATLGKVQAAVDEDPSLEFVDNQLHGNRPHVRLTGATDDTRKRIKLGDEIPGVAQLVEKMATLSAGEVLHLVHEHQLDDVAQQAAASAAAVAARRSAIGLKMMSSRPDVPMPAGDPEKPREMRIGMHQDEKMCLTHNTHDHRTEMTKCKADVTQSWYFHNEKLKVMNSSLCLAVLLHEKQLASGALNVGQVVLDVCADAPNQKFYLDRKSLKNKANETACASVMEDMTVIMDECKTEDMQEFFRHPPNDCEWGEWSRWGTCTTTCGGGRQRRERTVVLEAEPFGYPCLGDDFEVGMCSKIGCPISCEWGDWMSWSDCTMSCGGGEKTKKRLMRVEAMNGGRQCNGDPFQNTACNTKPCPVDCTWGLWDEWADCTKTCGGGIRRRERAIVSTAMFGGKACPDSGAFALEGASMITDATLEVSQRDQFGSWSKCQHGFHAVGIGTFELMNQVANDMQNLLDFECNLNKNACRVYCSGSDCKFATRCAAMGDGKTELGTMVQSGPDEWGPFSTCPEKFEVFGFAKLSILEAHKTLANVNDFYCNATGCRAWCQDSGCEYQSMCGSKVKVVTGRSVRSERDVWGERSSCPKNMMVIGLSQVTLLEPSEGLENLNRWDCNDDGCRAWCWGSPCTVVTRCMAANAVAGVFEEAQCSWRPCPIDCELSEWSSWAECSKSCGGGLKARDRQPVVTAENGGAPCGYLGLSTEHHVCNALPCPIDCVWSQWGEWADCAVSCGGGQRVRQRVVARASKNNGAACKGVFELVDVCGTGGCPQDCKYAMWSAWDACTKTCGGDGFRRREREMAVEVRNGGKMCTGYTAEVDDSCADKPCPVDCLLDVWTTWSACSVPCGVGQKTRFRDQTVPKMYGGKACSGSTFETAKCTERACGPSDKPSESKMNMRTAQRQRN